MSKISFEQIEKFLKGRDPQKYIVSIETTYNSNIAHIIINDPEKGKLIQKQMFKPFIWVKASAFKKIYGGNESKIRKAMSKFKITSKKLRTYNDEGYSPQRMLDGYRYILHTTEAYTNILNFFSQGGLKIYDDDNPQNKNYFITLHPTEQFMVQTGKRLFKGFDDYDDLDRLQFDLETEGLDPSNDAIFQIGIKNNKGFEYILETKGKTEEEKNECEKNNIIIFFNLIIKLKPDIITAYNSENFDWPFFEERCKVLGIDYKGVVKTLNKEKNIYRRENNLKLGQDTEKYLQTYMWGFNILDTSHAVRRAQSINSDIKKWSLKYITKFSKIAKPNRVYVPGNKINEIWSDKRDYWFNDEDGSWNLLKDDNTPKNSKIVKGNYIVQRYLLDDLWETEKVDYIYNQATFLLSKILPTNFMKTATMGTAGQWSLIMSAWSYENGLAIPDKQPKEKFVGGLSRLLMVGYPGKNGVVKFDFAALYPKTQLTWGIFPDLDIMKVMEGLLTYVVDERDKFKFLTSDHKTKSKELQKLLDKNIHKLNEERINRAKEMIQSELKISSDYDKKQLPLKILANSWFGSYGAPYIFAWGDIKCAEETTCRGRQSLRKMISFFTEKYNFKPLVLDTDGCNFSIPDNINEISYVVKANHWKTEKYKPNEILYGLEAVTAEFNETFMEGRMGLDVDDIYESAINFKRKNYANRLDGEIKLVGNSIKSKTMPTYIEEFINEGVGYLLDGDGKSFVELYYKTVDDIYNYRIPAIKIASKSKVKMSLDEYINNYCKQKTKAGQLKSRQAHMELAIKEELDVKLGDVIYYINTGTAKSHGDIKRIINKETKEKETVFNCQLIPSEQIEYNPDMIIDDYNVAKYINGLNERISSLLVCFDYGVRDNILINVVKDKKTKKPILEERNIFTDEELELVFGKPLEEGDQDDYYEDLMKMEDREIKFWISVNKLPNFMEEQEWENIIEDYEIRKEEERINTIKEERKLFVEFFNKISLEDYEKLTKRSIIPKKILIYSFFNENGFISKKTNEVIYSLEETLNLKEIILKRNEFMNNLGVDYNYEQKYEAWLNNIH